MKKKTGIIAVTVIGVLALIYGITVKRRGAAAISIIGGADGPTSVFLAGKIGHGYSLGFIIFGVIVLLITLILLFRSRK